MNIQKLMCEYLRRQLNGVAMMAIPAGGELLWRWFIDISSGRTYGMSGPNPISFTEIQSYAAVSRWPILPHHVIILRAMDAVWLENAYAKKADAPEGTKTLPPRSKGKLTAGMFDAMFGGK
jgi:hypothetical protein